MTVDQLIEAFGGNLAMSQIAGVGHSAVSNWRRFGRLPPRLYLRLDAAGKERGIYVDPELFRAMPSTAPMPRTSRCGIPRKVK